MKRLPALAFLTALSMLASAAVPAAAQMCKAAVPDSALVKKGRLVMSVNPTLPPMQFVDRSGELKGMRIELGDAIAHRLCLTPEYVRIEFSAMIPGLNARRWDMINTGIFYTEERTRIMQMLAYEDQAISISVRAGNELGIRKPADLAGRSIGVELGGFEERRARDLDRQLREQGLKGITVRTFENFSMAFQALGAGQVDAAISIDATAVEYQKRGRFQRVVNGLFRTPVALATKDRQLANAIAKALNEMRADGSFQKLFAQYGVEPVAGTIEVKGPAS